MRLLRPLLLVLGAALASFDLPATAAPPRDAVTLLAPHIRSESAAFPTGDGRALFVGIDDAGAEPWITDGTPEGTRPLADLFPGPRDSDPWFAGVVGGRALIVASSDEAATRRTWSVPLDGSAAPELLADGPIGTAAALGERAVFHLDGLWITDGTPAGTSRISDMPALRGPLHSLGDHVVFFTDDGVENWEGTDDLRVTDGTPEGTTTIANVGRISYRTGRFSAVARDGVWFAGPGGMWVTDGTAAGTGFTRSILADDAGFPEPWIHAAHGIVAWTAHELNSARLVGSIDFGTPGFARRNYRGPASAGFVLGASGPNVFFSAVRGRWPRCLRGELRVTDGTGRSHALGLPLSLRPSHDVHPVGESGRVVWLTGSGGRSAPRLVVSDGTRRGTRVVAALGRRVRPRPPHADAPPSPRVLAVLGTRVLCAVEGEPAGAGESYALAAVDVGDGE